MKKFLPLLAAAALLFSAPAFASCDDLGVGKKKIENLAALAGTSVASGVYIPVCDATTGTVVKVDAGSYIAALAGYTGTAAELNYVDLATLGTGAASKAVVLDASGDYTYPATGTIVYPSSASLTLNSGSTFDVAGTFEIANVAMTASAAELNYNDIATLGTVAASKALTFDASIDAILPTGALTTYQSGAGLTMDSGSVLTINAVAVNKLALEKQGRGFFTVCGDATTVNNNTVYYGPSEALSSSATVGGVTCDTTAAGNTTEATADVPALSNTAIYPLGMVCYNSDNASGITYTLRSAAAAITPAIAVTLADNVLSNAVSVTATTAIAAGATVAVAASSSGDIGTVPFVCRVNYAF